MKSNRIPVGAFHADDSFIGRVQKLVREEVLPYQYQILNDAIPDVEKSHAIENIRLAAKKGECLSIDFLVRQSGWYHTYMGIGD